MPVDCQRSTSGGKGNLGMFIERNPRICAAGLPTAQPDDTVSESMQHYLLSDQVDALISDAIIPSKTARPPPQLRRPIPPDNRFAGLFTDVADLVNPQGKAKFETLIDDMKNTVYSSYWNKTLGKVKDIVPLLPEGFDAKETTFGKPTPDHGRLYDIVMPKDPHIDKVLKKNNFGTQLKRNYCKPAFNSDLTFGRRTHVDKRGSYAKCCLTDDRVKVGKSSHFVTNTVHANFQDKRKSRLGAVLAPNENIKNVPEGSSFGKVISSGSISECLVCCNVNPSRDILRTSLKHLNSLRRVLYRRFSPNSFRLFHLNLKYLDKEKIGWLHKEIVYNYLTSKLIRFEPELIEPLLDMWQAFDGLRIKYETFIRILNYRNPLPDMPFIPDISKDCLDYRTTYTEMTNLDKAYNKRSMAGVPSGRYIDLDYPITPENYSKAMRDCLPQESDMKSCISPCVLTLLHVNHRDMYAKREPSVVRRVFEASGEKFTDEEFDTIWKKATSFHSEGWVCFETFRKALCS